MKRFFLLIATMLFFVSLIVMAQEPQAEKKECSHKADSTKAAAADTTKTK